MVASRVSRTTHRGAGASCQRPPTLASPQAWRVAVRIAAQSAGHITARPTADAERAGCATRTSQNSQTNYNSLLVSSAFFCAFSVFCVGCWTDKRSRIKRITVGHDAIQRAHTEALRTKAAAGMSNLFGNKKK